MSITAAEVLTFLNAKLIRTETTADIQEVLRDALQRLARDGDFLQGTATGTVSDGDTALDYPTDYKSKIDLWVYLSSDTEPKPLGKMEEGQRPGLSEGQPSVCNEFNGQFLFNYEANQDYLYALDYYKYHARSSTIEFGDEFRQAVYYLTTGLFAAGKSGLGDEEVRWLGMYEGELEKLKDQVKTRPRFVRYSDC